MKKTTFTIGMIGLMMQFAGPHANAQVNLEYKNGPTSIISPTEIQTIKVWSQNANADIERLLNNVQTMIDSSDMKRKLSIGMETVVQNSEPKASDLLLRHAIYAGLTVNKLIEQESIRKGMMNTPQGTVDQQVRILKKSLMMAQEYYTSDFKYIDGLLTQKNNNGVNPKLVEFGVRFSSFLIKMSDGVLDASASYGMIRWSLGILSSYLNQDSRNVAYASTIKYLFDELKQYPDIVTGQAAPEDFECIKYTRELKRIAQEVFREIKQTTVDLNTSSTYGSNSSSIDSDYHPSSSQSSSIDSDSFADLTGTCNWFDGDSNGISKRGWHLYAVTRGVYVSKAFFGNDNRSSSESCHKEMLAQREFAAAVASAKSETCKCDWISAEDSNGPSARGWHMLYTVKVGKRDYINVSNQFFGNESRQSEEACKRELVQQNFKCS